MYISLQGWIKPIDFGNLDRLSLYANDQFRFQPLQDAFGKYGEVIEMIKECCGEWEINQSTVADGWCKETSEEGEIFIHMTRIAVLSVLGRKLSHGRILSLAIILAHCLKSN